MKIQGHNLLSVTPVQPQHEGHKAGDPRDGGFARLLSEQQSSSKVLERQSIPKLPEQQSSPRPPERQPSPKAHDAAHPPQAAHAPAPESAPAPAPHQERKASDRPREARPGDDQNATVQDPADADVDGAATTASTATAKPRGQARAQGANSCARHPATDATRAAQSGQAEQRVDSGAEVLAQPGAANEAQGQTTDTMLAQWLATLPPPAAPLPEASPTGTIDPQAAAAAGGVALGAELPPAAPELSAPGLSTLDAAPGRSSKAAAAGAGSAVGREAGAQACTAASTATDVGTGTTRLPLEPGVSASLAQRSAVGTGAAGAAAVAAEADDIGTYDTSAAQLAAQSTVQALARDAALLAGGAAEYRPQGVDGITAAAGMPLAPFTPGTHAAREVTAATPVVLSTPVASPDFQQALAVQVSVLARDGVQHAELHLHPADMGPVSVRIALEGTLARVEFGADLAATRQAIETGLPELASALRDAGLTLSGGGVSEHSRGRDRGHAGHAERHDPHDSSRQRTHDMNEPVGRVIRRTVTAGGVDLYA